VRIELEQALARGVRVIPVLVDGASMPSAEELPESLRPLSRRHAVELSHVRFGTDAQRLVEALKSIIVSKSGAATRAPSKEHLQRVGGGSLIGAILRVCSVVGTVVLVLVTLGMLVRHLA
jgi:hypothetical protein